MLANGADPNQRHEGVCPLHGAALPCVRQLLNAGADIEAVAEFEAADSHGRSPLAEACGGWSDAAASSVPALLMAGAAANVSDRQSGNTPLHWAAAKGRPAAAAALLAWGADPQARNSEGQIPLHLAAGEHNSETGVLNVLLAASPDAVHAVDNKGNTPLHIASMSREWAKASALVLAGGDPNAQNDAGRTPAAFARFVGGEDADDTLALFAVTCGRLDGFGDDEALEAAALAGAAGREASQAAKNPARVGAFKARFAAPANGHDDADRQAPLPRPAETQRTGSAGSSSAAAAA